MLKLSTSYSKKIPAEQEYSSQSFHCAVELELSDNLTPEQLQTQIHETFGLVKRSVEAELNGKARETPKHNQPSQSNGNGNGAKATNKQVKFILDLGKGQGFGLSDINAQVRTRFDADTVYDLTRKDASAFVDDLKTRKLAA